MTEISDFFQNKMKNIIQKDYKVKIDSYDLLNSKIFLIDSKMSVSLLFSLKKREIGNLKEGEIISGTITFD